MLEVFCIKTWLKQEDALFPLLFNIAIKKAVRVLQNEARGLNVDQYQIKMLEFADDFNILGEFLDDTVRVTEVLECAAEQIRLQINTDKTMLIELLNIEKSPDVMETLLYYMSKLKSFSIWVYC